MSWEFTEATTAAPGGTLGGGPRQEKPELGKEPAQISLCNPNTWKLTIIFALNFSIRSALLEFLLNDTNHPWDPGQLGRKCAVPHPFPGALIMKELS